MKHTITPDRKTLIITVDEAEREELREMEDCGEKIQSDESMHDFFEPLTCNSELDWVDPADTGDLTDAPMLATFEDDADGDRKPVERWAFMDYQVASVLERLRDRGSVEFVGGTL